MSERAVRLARHLREALAADDFKDLVDQLGDHDTDQFLFAALLASPIPAVAQVEATKPWEETWELLAFDAHHNATNEWMHTVSLASCPHKCGKCEVVTFESVNAAGRCDDAPDAVVNRARLAAAAPELYRALEAMVGELERRPGGEPAYGIPGNCMDVCRAALRKARGD